MFEALINQWQQQSLLEVVAFLLSVAYVCLAAKQNIWCWLCAFVSTSIYVYLFYSVSLPFHSLLNAYYIVMAVVGFMSWRKGTKAEPLQVQALSFNQHAIVIALGAVLASILSMFAGSWFDASWLALDATITVFSVFATLMTARKYIDNWYYWLVLNSAACFLFVQKELYLTALLMIIYTFVAIYGLFEWRKSLKPAIINP
ncbi:nicotinamide riboside transporter PnuC [Glaciecola sp. KUL10]|jgi:nicotinamide mononucleotide transporter|uniref:nicotinamide riboside transporter PnuC n=1 Tax=Glaciecola sp. (strain KUL10) TaxID=2161813 RepID=UPI000D782953|nr:nicotinamide riboside transporter PnuC [Glaciecola sp. KUL10]GBL03963.1 nicotinamide mononucleotide transporter [Glaciecola sp. KUL10]